MIELFEASIDIMDINEDVPLQVVFSVFLKNVIRITQGYFEKDQKKVDMVISIVRILLRIPKDKSFESASIYAGNLAIILFDKVLGKKHNDILQEICLLYTSPSPRDQRGSRMPSSA